MKYTDSKNNITFNNVKEAGVYHASGPIGLNGLYTTSGANITDINSNLSLINAIDINWNGALVEPGVELNTTGDLLRWIKEHFGGSQGNVELTINSQGYWCINGVSTGVKAQGEDGLTPHIGSNGNWWIGNTDTGVSANAKTIVENNISYTSDISGTTAGNYRLGTLNVGTSSYPILGKDLGGENISVSYLDSVGTNVQGRYTIGTLQIGNNAPITLNGINTVGEGGGGVTPNISATASIDGGTGTPSVTVTKSGSNESPNFNFAFHNLKGEQGNPGSGGEGGTTYIENPYDDSQIRTALSDLDNALSVLRSTVSAIRNWSEEQINDLINQGLNDWEIGEHITPDEIFNLNGWNDKLKEFIQLIAFKDSKNNELTISQIIQRLESIEGIVDDIKIVDENGDTITLEQLISRVKVAVEEDINGYLTAVAQLEAAFTKFTTGSSDESEFTLLKSNFAAFLALANDKIAELTAAVDSKATKDYVDQETGKVRTAIGEATAGFYTKSEVDGKIATATAQLVSESTMQQYVNGKETELRDAISGLYTKTEVDNKISQATANLVTEATMEDYVTGEINTAKSGLATKSYVDDEITSASASLLASAELTDKINGTVQSATSGFVTKTEVYTKELTDGLIASARSDMMSEIDGKYAKITTAVTKTDNGNGTYSIDSNIIISADLIELDGETIFRKLSADLDNGISYNGHDGVIIDPTKLLFYSSVYNGAARSYTEIDAYGIHSYEDMAGLPIESYYKPEGIELYYGYDNDRPGELIKKVGIDYNQVYFDVPTTIDDDLDVNGDLNIGHDLTVSGTITTNNLSLSPDGTNGTFLVPYGLYSVYNKYYSGSWGGEQLRIKLSLQTGSNDDSTVECAVNNIKLLGNYIAVGNFDGGASGMIVQDSNVELRSQTNIKFNNIITLAPAINGTEKTIANFLYDTNDLEIETPNGVCKIPDLYSDSDETVKENITEVSSNILDIANARIVDFNFKGKSTIKFGSIAQDWQNIFPNAVKETTNGILCMDYGAIALGSAVTAAREIVALKEENQQLKDRLAAIEQKLEAINNALG